jgi:hypothetical protein
LISPVVAIDKKLRVKVDRSIQVKYCLKRIAKIGFMGIYAKSNTVLGHFAVVFPQVSPFCMFSGLYFPYFPLADEVLLTTFFARLFTDIPLEDL